MSSMYHQRLLGVETTQKDFNKSVGLLTLRTNILRLFSNKISR